jgi:hypothetical protein
MHFSSPTSGPRLSISRLILLHASSISWKWKYNSRSTLTFKKLNNSKWMQILVTQGFYSYLTRSTDILSATTVADTAHVQLVVWAVLWLAPTTFIYLRSFPFLLCAQRSFRVSNFLHMQQFSGIEPLHIKRSICMFCYKTAINLKA